MSSHAIRISRDLFDVAQIRARAQHRSVPGQIEYWSKLGRLAEENPDLSIAAIKEILLSLEEGRADHVSEYQFGWTLCKSFKRISLKNVLKN